MLTKTDLLALMHKCQNKTEQTKIFFSLSTSIKILRLQPIDNIFVMTFGKNIDLPFNIVSRHSPVKLNDFISNQPFKLDTIIVSINGNTIIDPFNGSQDIKHKIIQTVDDPRTVLNTNPFLIIRAAAIIAETEFTPHPSLIKAIEKNTPQLRYIKGKLIWREFKRILRAPKPSIGIEFLRKIGALEIILPELQACHGIQQNTKYHKYSVYEHCLLSCDSSYRDNILLRFAALIHDVGKPETLGYNRNGITFHKHEVASAKLSIRIVNRFRLKKNDAIFIVNLVQYHMYQYDRAWKDSTVIKFIKKVGLDKSYLKELHNFPLFLLRDFDRLGRGLPPITQKQRDFENRIYKFLSLEIKDK